MYCVSIVRAREKGKKRGRERVQAAAKRQIKDGLLRRQEMPVTPPPQTCCAPTICQSKRKADGRHNDTAKWQQ